MAIDIPIGGYNPINPRPGSQVFGTGMGSLSTFGPSLSAGKASKKKWYETSAVEGYRPLTTEGQVLNGWDPDILGGLQATYGLGDLNNLRGKANIPTTPQEFANYTLRLANDERLVIPYGDTLAGGLRGQGIPHVSQGKLLRYTKPKTAFEELTGTDTTTPIHYDRNDPYWKEVGTLDTGTGLATYHDGTTAPMDEFDPTRYAEWEKGLNAKIPPKVPKTWGSALGLGKDFFPVAGAGLSILGGAGLFSDIASALGTGASAASAGSAGAGSLTGIPGAVDTASAGLSDAAGLGTGAGGLQGISDVGLTSFGNAVDAANVAQPGFWDSLGGTVSSGLGGLWNGANSILDTKLGGVVGGTLLTAGLGKLLQGSTGKTQTTQGQETGFSQFPGINQSLANLGLGTATGLDATLGKRALGTVELPKLDSTGLFPAQRTAFDEAVKQSTSQISGNLAGRGMLTPSAVGAIAGSAAQNVAPQYKDLIGQNIRDVVTIPEVASQNRLEQLLTLLRTYPSLLGGTTTGNTVFPSFLQSLSTGVGTGLGHNLFGGKL